LMNLGPLLEGRRQRGLDNTRRDGVDANPEAADFGRKTLYQQADRGLCRTIHRKPRLDGDGAHGRTGDQAAALLVDHDAPKALEKPHRALDVEGDDAVEILLGVVEN